MTPKSISWFQKSLLNSRWSWDNCLQAIATLMAAFLSWKIFCNSVKGALTYSAFKPETLGFSLSSFLSGQAFSPLFRLFNLLRHRFFCECVALPPGLFFPVVTYSCWFCPSVFPTSLYYILSCLTCTRKKSMLSMANRCPRGPLAWNSGLVPSHGSSSSSITKLMVNVLKGSCYQGPEPFQMLLLKSGISSFLSTAWHGSICYSRPGCPIFWLTWPTL